MVSYWFLDLTHFIFSAGFFPITGGNLQGSIGRNVDDSYLNLYSATYWNKGGHISLSSYQALENPGGFKLCTGNNSNSSVKYLIGKPDGTLTWVGNDLAGTAIVAKSLNINGYIKFASGLIIQWFRSSDNAIESGINGTSTAYPLQFPKSVYCGTMCAGTVISRLAIATIRTFAESTDEVTWYPATYNYNDTSPIWNTGWVANTYIAYFIVFGH